MHSFQRLRYMLVLKIRDGAPLLRGEVERVVHRRLEDRLRHHGAHVRLVGGDEDHVHVALDIPGSVVPHELVCKAKAETTGWVRRRFPHLGFGWEPGYAMSTLQGSGPFDQKILDYIANQRRHHAEDDLIPHLEWPNEPPPASPPGAKGDLRTKR